MLKIQLRAFVLLAAMLALSPVFAVTTIHRSFRTRDTGYVNGGVPGSSTSLTSPNGSTSSAQPKAVRGKAPNKLVGSAAEILDGGTVVIGGEKVVLAHIEAPRAAQPFGPEAAKFLGDLLRGKEIEVLWKKRTRDGAILGEVYYRHEKFGMVDANLTMVKNGAAWHATNDFEKTYASAEKEARAAKRGLWSAPKPVRPSLWRENLKNKE